MHRENSFANSFHYSTKDQNSHNFSHDPSFYLDMHQYERQWRLQVCQLGGRRMLNIRSSCWNHQVEWIDMNSLCHLCQYWKNNVGCCCIAHNLSHPSSKHTANN